MLQPVKRLVTLSLRDLDFTDDYLKKKHSNLIYLQQIMFYEQSKVFIHFYSDAIELWSSSCEANLNSFLLRSIQV